MKNFIISSIEQLKPWLLRTLTSTRYALHTIVHPFNGFWELKHEKQGTVAGANIIILLTLMSILWKQQFTSFLFSDINWDQVNIWLVIAQFLAPLTVWVVANWCLTTLFDGKGNLKEIYIMTAYAIAPFPLLQIPLIFVSNLIAADEGALYVFFDSLSYLWSGGLLLCGLMMTHDYSLSKVLVSTFATIVGMAVIIVICLLVFSMSAEAVGYVVSLVQELIIRFY